LAILNNAAYGLQQISIASLVIALGLLVDNGIVVTENITRFIKEGYNKKEASLKGASEVGMAITSSTVTTLLSFFPLTQLGEGAGLFIISMPLTVIFTLLISLILALTFSPIMSSWVFSSKPAQRTIADRSFDWFSTRIYRPI
jgi:multidrug efflux pump subunit AcrB